jgi:predicted ATPase/tetratricopeptide (TPR) repeat protein
VYVDDQIVLPPLPSTSGPYSAILRSTRHGRCALVAIEGQEHGSRVFISHAHADVEQARRLKKGLATRGLDGWLAPDDMVGRDSWVGELVAEIARCESFVVLVSSTALASKHVEREVTLAVEHNRLLVPVLLEEVALSGPLSYLLSSRHWVEAAGGISDDTVEIVSRRLRSATPPNLPSSTSKPGRVAWDESRVPMPLDPIVGRDSLVESLVNGVRAGRRLTTLRGPGGVGKTRLALEVAQRVLVEGLARVVFVDLSEATNASELMVEIANAVGYSGPDPGDPAEVAGALPGSPMLLVCDNLEQVAAESRPLHQFLEKAPHLMALVTSRVRLGFPGEHVVVVPPLVTDDASAISPAVEMFLQVAKHVDPGFDPLPNELTYVDRVCRAVDGLPLALELAASRVSLMSPAQLWERVGRPVSRTAARPGSARQSSVEATIEWSLSLLTPRTLAGFARLGVFTGGFTLEAVESVCADDGEDGSHVDEWLAELVDASLVQSADAPSGRRFFMLHLLLAEARRRAVDPALEQRHATFFAELAEKHRPDMVGPRGAAVIRGLVDDLANWSQALSWASTHDPHLYCRLARQWRPVWVTAMRAADVFASPLSPEGRTSLSAAEQATLEALSGIAAFQAGVRGAAGRLRRATDGTTALAGDPELVVLLWSFLAAACVDHGDKDDAREAARFAREYADEHGDAHARAVAYDISGWAASLRGDLADAHTFAEQSIQLAEEQDDDLGVCFALHALGSVLIEEGDEEGVRASAARLLALVEAGRGLEANEFQGEYLLRMADLMAGDLASAASRLLRALTRSDPLPAEIVGSVLTAAAVLAAAGHLDDAHRALARARELAQRFDEALDDSHRPEREQLARLETESPPPRDATFPDTGSVVPPALLEALRRVVVGSSA